MSWSNKYKRSIDCDNPHGFSQKAHCAARKKRASGGKTKSKSPFNEMHEIKSHKSVEKIAKKHRLDVSFVRKQLEMGIPIEHEHTGDRDLATDIALQHLDEIPDYYTRLKKMESDAKKEHKKFKDVEEEYDSGIEWNDLPILGVKAERFCPKCNKIEVRSECKYGGLYWDLYSLPPKLAEETASGDDSLHDWFQKSSGKDPKTGRKVKGWRQIGGPFAGAPCARQPGQTSTPKCGSSKMAANLSNTEEDEAFRRKNRQDPNQPEKTGGAKPTYVRTEEMDLEEDACKEKVKSRYKVWPSAYASGALVKCRKVGAKNWGTKSEETMHEEERYCPLCDKRETRSECSYGGKAWDKVSVKDHEYSMARSELSTMADAVKRLQMRIGKGEGNLQAWVQSKITKAADYIDTAADYMDSGEMKKEEKLVDKITSEILDEKCWKGFKRKKGTEEFEKGSCVKSESITIEDADGNPFLEVVDLISPEPIKGFKSQVNEATRLQAQTGNVVCVVLSWRGKYYSVKMFFPQVKLPTKRDMNDELQKVYPGCNVISHYVSDFQPGQPLLQGFGPQGGSSAKLGPNMNYVKPMGEEIELEEGSPAWQRKEGKNPEGGLNKAGIASYRKQHPGSHLSMAVTTPPSELDPNSKAANRRKSFCARMGGMPGPMKDEKGRPTRKALSLKKWNCRGT